MDKDINYLFARAIYRLHADRSVSSLLDNKKIIQSMLEKSKKPRSKEASKPTDRSQTGP